MNGNGCAGSSACGVRIGKICSRKCAFEPGLGLALDRIGFEHVDAGIGQLRRAMSGHTLCWLSAQDRRPPPRSPRAAAPACGRRPSGPRPPASCCAHQAGDAHHEEFVEVRAGDREEAQPLEQWMRGVARLFHHPAVEGQPAQLAVEIALHGFTRRISSSWTALGRHSRCLWSRSSGSSVRLSSRPFAARVLARHGDRQAHFAVRCWTPAHRQRAGSATWLRSTRFADHAIRSGFACSSRCSKARSSSCGDQRIVGRPELEQRRCARAASAGRAA